MKTKQQILKKISKIAGLCAQISQETEHDAFFRYYGHTQWVDIDVHKGGWKADCGPTKQYTVYCDNEKSLDRLKDIEFELTEFRPRK